LREGHCSSLLLWVKCIPITTTRGNAMGNSTKVRKADSSVDAWAILCLIVLVVVTAVYWVSHQ